jgi:hypothetical protein
MRKDGSERIEWRGDRLCLIGQRQTIVSIEPDATYPQMWRVRYPDGSLSDMVNKTRARDAIPPGHQTRHSVTALR